MTVTNFHKAIAYVAATLLCIGTALWITAPLMGSEDLVAAYLRSDILLFLTACTLMGVGVYSWWGFTRRRYTAHRGDSLFWLLWGAVWMILTVVVICRFGGVNEESFADGGEAMVNLNLVVAGLLPLPPLVRLVTLLPAVERGRRAIAAVGTLAVTGVYIALIAAGKLLHTVTF